VIRDIDRSMVNSIFSAIAKDDKSFKKSPSKGGAKPAKTMDKDLRDKERLKLLY
jgi:hypothetical protein